MYTTVFTVTLCLKCGIVWILTGHVNLRQLCGGIVVGVGGEYSHAPGRAHIAVALDAFITPVSGFSKHYHVNLRSVHVVTSPYSAEVLLFLV